MKKLNKLRINPEKVMKNEELVTLRGGGDPCTCSCRCGYLLSVACNCEVDCKEACGY
jgi:natural product precursor